MGKTFKHRNPFAVPAKLRSGAGKHKDRRRSRDKYACRGRIRPEDYEDLEDIEDLDGPDWLQEAYEQDDLAYPITKAGC